MRKISSYHPICLCVGVLLAFLAVSCSKMDTGYKEFLENGETRYSKRPDSVSIFPGHGRAEAWIVLSDPNIVVCRVFWNDGLDSLSIPVDIARQADTIIAVIDGLEEGFYNFEFYTYDLQGNRSIRLDTIGQVYGDAYISTLSARPVYHAVLQSGLPKIVWYPNHDAQMIGVKLRYYDKDGGLHESIIPAEDSITRVQSKLQGDSLSYSTLYQPTPDAIDTFYTAFQTLHLEEAVPVLLDKSKFSEYVLPGDAPGYKSGVMSNLWDGDLAGKSWYRTDNGSGVPHYYTFDMGVLAKLSSYTSWQRGAETEHKLLYTNANVSKWEVWGCSEEPKADGSWDGWVKLLDCEPVKPSGTPAGTTTDADLAQALAGDSFQFSEDSPPVRYIRIKVLEDWAPSNSDHSFFEEFSFYGIVE